MALPALFSTPLDIRNLSEYITTSVRTNAHITSFIVRGDALIKDALREVYTVPDNLNETTPWNGPPQTPVNVEDVTQNTGTGALLDITVGASAVTELWTLTYTSTTAFSITGSVSGSQGTGSKDSDSSSTNSYITVPTAKWTGTPASGDVFYIAVYKVKPMVVALSTHMAAGLLLHSVFHGAEGVSGQAKFFMTQAQDWLKRLQKPYDDDGLRLDSFSARDITPEGIQYAIDALGRDVSKYADNENTPWDDSAQGGSLTFFTGPIW